MIKTEKIKLVFILFVIGLFMTSCVTNKNYVYLQDKGGINIDSLGNMPVQAYSYKLQKGDILYISLFTEDEKLNRVFVPSSNAGGNQVGAAAGSMYYFTGFTLDTGGCIELPYLGTIPVASHTITEARSIIETELKKYFKTFFLQVKVAEFKFSIFGSVRSPGQYFFQQNKVSIIEAIIRAGELDNMATRTEIQLYRQYPEGIRLIKIDLTDRRIINSPYWYIQPNDIVYVKPLPYRTIGDISTVPATLGVVAPILNTMLLLINTYFILNSIK